MADPPRTEQDRPGVDLAAEAERSRTPWTPFLALGGVWLAVAAVVAVVVVVVVLAVTLSR